MPIAIVGAGAVAQALGRSLSLRGAPVVALASRSRPRAEKAAVQTFAGAALGVERLERITFGLAGDRQALDWAGEIVNLLECRGLYIASDRLSWYHAGAVLASYALVAAVDAATILMDQAGVERQSALQALEPLSRTTLDCQG